MRLSLLLFTFSAGAIAAGPNIAFCGTSTIVVANRRSVTSYAPGNRGDAAPIARIGASLVAPAGIAADSAGNTYVTLPEANAVAVFAASASGNSVPMFSIEGSKTGLAHPVAIAVDFADHIYVANDGSENGGADSITVYAARASGNSAPIGTIAGSETGLGGPHGIALDSGGKIYVANDNSNINIYAPLSSGNVKPLFSIYGLATAVASAITLDSSGNIYIGADDFFQVPGRILIYRRGEKLPAAQIFGPHTGLGSPNGIAVDNDFIYATNNPKERGAYGNVSLYPTLHSLMKRPRFHDWTPLKTIGGADTGLSEPWGIALPQRRIRVANRFGDSITTYSPAQFGNIMPAATIAGDLNGLSNAAGIAVDSGGNIYVADSGASLGEPGSIRIFSPGSDGDARPARVIGGAAAKLNEPSAIALDPRGYIVVANHRGPLSRNGSVNIFSACTVGNVAPFATIEGIRTGLNDPSGIAIDAQSNIFVANYSGGPLGTGSVTRYSRGGNGDIAPAAVIAAPQTGADRTGLNTPVAIALDSDGNIYVANDGGVVNGVSALPSINIYPPGASGNVTPIGEISGAATSLYDLGGIAVGPGDDIYAIVGGTRIAIYPAPRFGRVNRPPISTIAGSATRLDAPQGIALIPSATRMPPCRDR
ncbi:MAG TPA: NHL repeat-containing protein [Candidatus Binataceae bacterium]|nr:NHL repeat-containing protein [Candidatus Binataceae bacterium]